MSIIKALAAASALGVVLGLLGLVDSLRFSAFSEGLRKSGIGGGGGAPKSAGPIGVPNTPKHFTPNFSHL